MAVYKKRYLEDRILALSAHFPVILVTGARQVGKTTLLAHLIQKDKKGGRRYVSMDEFETRTLAKRDPALFLERYPAPLMIDEIQYAPELLPYLKTAVDRNARKGAYWLTGSQQFHLMRHVSESLAGRVAILTLMGLSRAEEKQESYTKEPWRPDRHHPRTEYPALPLLDLFRHIVRGSFPGLLGMPGDAVETFFGSYVQTYIDRDLRDLLRVRSLAGFEKFVRICAARTASMLNLSEIARDSGISVSTAKAWLSLLEASHQIFLLKPFYRNLSKRLIKTPKLYFLDTGLVCYLTGWRNPEVAARGAFAGQLFETFVVSEVLKSYLHRGKEARIFYYRTKEKTEVDLLIEENGVLFPVEVKLSARVQSGDLKGMYSLYRNEKMRVGEGAVIAPVRTPYVVAKNGRGVWVLPATAIR